MTEKPPARDERLLVSLALLQVNWERSGRSHFDNFVPFAVDAMRRDGKIDYSDNEVRDAVQRHFGIALSTAVISAVLKRAKDESYGFRTGPGRFQLNPDEAETISLIEQEQTFSRTLRHLNESLVEHASSAFQTEWGQDEAEGALIGYVEQNSAALLGTALSGTAIPSPDSVDVRQVIVASWIERINQSDPTRFEYLLTVIKGSMLATGLFLTPGAHVDERFRNTSLVFDTPFLLRALGYEGDDARDAGRDVLTLARSQGARLVCFERTVAEMRRVLGSAAQSVGRARNESTRAVDVYFAAEGLTRAQVETFAEKLEINLRLLGVEVAEHPQPIERLTVDEVELEDALEATVHYGDRRDALFHDLELLTAVYRLRGAAPGDRLENCRAVLITTNRGLVRVARNFPDFAEHAWPLGMTDDNVATLLWVKQPMAAPELPKHQLLAQCFTVLAPSHTLWGSYLSQIERLRNADELTDDEVTLLRYRQEAQRALVRETLGRSDDIDPSVIRAVLDRAEAEIRAPAHNQMLLTLEVAAEAERVNEEQRKELADASAAHETRATAAEESLRAEGLARQDAEKRAADARKREVTRIREAQARSETWAKRIRSWVTAVIALVLFSGVIWSDTNVGKVASVLIAVGAIAGNLLAPGRWAGERLGMWLFNRRLKVLHVDPAEANILLRESQDADSNATR